MDTASLGDGISSWYSAGQQFLILAGQQAATWNESFAAVSLGEWMAIFVCIVFSGVFSASETALTALTQPKVRQLIDKDSEKFAQLQLWIDYPNRVLSTILIGNNLVNILASALATDIARQIFGNRGVAVAVGVMTFLILVIGEVAPKTYAKHHAQTVALRIFPFLRIAYFVFFPATWVLVRLATGLVRLFGGDLKHSSPFVTEEDIEYLIDLGTREGVLDEDKERLLNSILEFDDITIREIMVPRTNMLALALDATPEQVIELANHSNHSRIPVYETQIDNVVGVLYLRDLFRMQNTLELENLSKRMADLLRPPYFVPGTMKISDLLQEFQRRKSHMAIVVDEFGGTMGLVTLEDILEEIVGEIHDEYDTEENEEVVPISEDVYHADAKVSLRSLEELLSIEFPDEGDYETLGGFLTAHAGRVPQSGDIVDAENYRFVVLEANEKHVSQVEIRRLEESPPNDPSYTPAPLQAAGSSDLLAPPKIDSL